MKKNFYFSHDYHARHDPKLLTLRRKLGLEGLGAYWCLVEFMYEQGGSLTVEEAHDLAYDLACDHNLLHAIISDFGLFQEAKDEQGKPIIVCQAITERLNLRSIRADKYSKNAQKRWKNADNDNQHDNSNAMAMQNECKSDALKGKERKGKENKENNNSIILLEKENHVLSDFLKKCPNVSRLKKQLTPDQVETLMAEFSRPEIESVLESMENYKDLQKKYASVYLTAKRWLALGRERQKQNSNGTAPKPTYTDTLKTWFNGASGHGS